MDKLKAVLGSKTFWAGVGLLGLAVYQLTQGNYEGAWQSAAAAAAALGIRHAIHKQGDA